MRKDIDIYINSANQYCNDMSKIQKTIEDILKDLQKTEEKLKLNDINYFSGEKQDALTYYVYKFNEDMIKIMNDLLPKYNSKKNLVMSGAKEISNNILQNEIMEIHK